jgi:hypothetical protein
MHDTDAIERKCLNHNDPSKWHDLPKRTPDGMVKTVCIACGTFICYRPPTQEDTNPINTLQARKHGPTLWDDDDEVEELPPPPPPPPSRRTPQQREADLQALLAVLEMTEGVECSTLLLAEHDKHWLEDLPELIRRGHPITITPNTCGVLVSLKPRKTKREKQNQKNSEERPEATRPAPGETTAA